MILTHYRLTGLALALVIAALLAPAAMARPIDQVTPQTERAHSSTATSTRGFDPSKLPHGAQYSSFDLGQASTPASDVTVARAPSNPGFDWGDAGIGAGAGFALAMIGLGGLLLLSSRRQRAEQPAPTA